VSVGADAASSGASRAPEAAPGALEAEAVKAQASGSSFYAGMRLLPKAERDAMFLIYHFCRVVDDIADDPGRTPAERTRELDQWRADLASLYQGGAPGVAAPVAGIVREFNLAKEDFLAVVDGMQMDVDQDIRGPDLATLDLYCDRVASAVGRLSVRVFGMDDAPGRTLAHHLGRAFQLTNILRDLDEDASIGRLYLPKELLQAAGITSRDPMTVIADPRVDQACRGLAAVARTHYADADEVFAARPTGRLIAAKMMRIVYGRLLDKTEPTGWAPPRVRAKLSKPELLWLILSGLFR
jgi:phytoene synthase